MIATALPAPEAEAREHADAVRVAVIEAIAAADGFLPFDRYMALVLYAPGLGYYASGAAKFGPAGDFTTAPELSPVFGACVAATAAEVLATVPGASILELGAGTGQLAVDVLLALDRRGIHPRRYDILEVSAELKARQAATLAVLPDALRARVGWLGTLPAGGFRGLILANEVADALPVRRFRRAPESVLELGVGLNDGRLAWAARSAGQDLENLVAALESARGQPFEEGYESEVAPFLDGFVGSLADGLEAGAILLCDYGMTRHDYYDPARARGTLSCYFRHRQHDDPFAYPGIQDLTAWVDFTRVAEAATRAGLEVAGYTSQTQFLIDTGFASELERAVAGLEGIARLNALNAAQTLILPGEMGEHFKCMALTRGADVTVGFRGRDFRDRL